MRHVSKVQEDQKFPFLNQAANRPVQGYRGPANSHPPLEVEDRNISYPPFIDIKVYHQHHLTALGGYMSNMEYIADGQ